jgi:hypothetical protein
MSLKLNRDFFKYTIADDMKQAFITIVQNHKALPQRDKDFICDNLQHYEEISQEARSEVLDVIDLL